VDYKLEPGTKYHSVGCDGRTEPAHYLVEFVKEQSNGKITENITKNPPRGGRSGGGVFCEDGFLIMVCSRGDSYGYWSSLNQIHKFLNDEKFTELLGATTLARRIPVFDWMNPNKKYPKDYIPL